MTSTDHSREATARDGDGARGGYGGLVAILAAILLGVLVGTLYGKTMWLASGGPRLALDRLYETRKQKEEFADRADKQAEAADKAGDRQTVDRRRAEAERFRGHVPEVLKEIGRVEKIVKEVDRIKEIVKEIDHVEKTHRPAEDVKAARMHVVAGLAWEFTKFFGDLFLQVLTLLVIPLVVTSMICGITSLGDVRKVGKVGLWTIVYYMTTGAVAVLIGIVLVQIIEPGKGADDTFSYATENVQANEDTTVLKTLLDVFRGRKDDPSSGMFPSNIFLAASNMNVLALIVFALLFGGALTTIGPVGTVAIDFFRAANKAVMKMVQIVMYVAPIGIFGLIAANIAKNGGAEGFGEQFGRLFWYVLTVLGGLAIHVLVLGGVLALLARRNPFAYTFNLLRALLTAMSTASSSATLPLTMECVEHHNKVSNRSASFVLPLGATVNMDGTALYEAVAAIFIAQSLDMDLGTGQLFVIFLTATLAAIGAAGIPEAGLVTMVIVLTAVGLPTSGIGTILAIDWFLDRMRTTVNVYGDAVGAGVIDRIVGSSDG